ncbi:MAG: glutamyl-tRNA reductase [Bacteroidetes bacterium]|nr:glutamyl-tRNA reductase [Bacteroidota bacterium]
MNYRKTSLEIRSKFALTTTAIRAIYGEAASDPGRDFFILSTCNRTEIYALAPAPEQLVDVFRTHCQVSEQEISEYIFIKKGVDAIRHLLRVASGIESQILGDYEIVGQLKKAFGEAKEYGMVSGLMEKLTTTALKTSKEVRSTTSLSDGTTSTSYAVVQLFHKENTMKQLQRLTLYGLGKIGTLTLRNLTHYLSDVSVTLVNRNEEKAASLAREFNVLAAQSKDLPTALTQSEVLVVATGADHPLVTAADIRDTPIRLIFDMSVPSNVAPEVRDLPGVRLYDIDQLSEIINETIDKRKNQVPFAEKIIEENISELIAWQRRRIEFTTQKPVSPDWVICCD